VIGVGRPRTTAKTPEVDAPDVARSVHIQAFGSTRSTGDRIARSHDFVERSPLALG
jgi:hypothetical protein